MALTIEVQSTSGSPLKVTGQKLGPFLVHEEFVSYSVFDLDWVWRVTHITCGARFPWDFRFKKEAVAFAKEVRSVLDWSLLKSEIVPGQTKVKLTWGQPTPKQLRKIREIAAVHGGVEI